MVWRCLKTTYIWKQSINLRPELKFKSKLLKILILKKLRGREAKKEKKKSLWGTTCRMRRRVSSVKTKHIKKYFKEKRKAQQLRHVIRFDVVLFINLQHFVSYTSTLLNLEHFQHSIFKCSLYLQ